MSTYRRKRRKIVDAVVKEISGVDRPANNRRFLLVKRADNIDENSKGGNFDDMTFEELIAKVEDEELRNDLESKIEVRKQWEDSVKEEKAKLEKRIEELESQLEKMQEDNDDKEGDAEDLPEDVQKRFDEMQQRIQAAEEMAKTEKNARMKVEFQKRAEGYSNVADVDKLTDVLMKAHAKDDELAEMVEDVLKSAHERIEKGDLFKQSGANDNEGPTTAYEKAVQRAEERIKDDSDLTLSKAITEELERDPDLYQQYLDENDLQ